MLILLVFFAGVSAAVVEQARWRMVLPIGAVSALGFAGFYAGELIGLGERITPIIGATIVGAWVVWSRCAWAPLSWSWQSPP